MEAVNKSLNEFYESRVHFECTDRKGAKLILHPGPLKSEVFEKTTIRVGHDRDYRVGPKIVAIKLQFELVDFAKSPTFVEDCRTIFEMEVNRCLAKCRSKEAIKLIFVNMAKAEPILIRDPLLYRRLMERIVPRRLQLSKHLNAHLGIQNNLTKANLVKHDEAFLVRVARFKANQMKLLASVQATLKELEDYTMVEKDALLDYRRPLARPGGKRAYILSSDKRA